jgi:hypothetical protein
MPSLSKSGCKGNYFEGERRIIKEELFVFNTFNEPG